MAVANSTNISTIQILRSYANSTPSTLADGQLAYSFVSNTLFIGSNTGVISIGDPSTAVIARSAQANTIYTQGVDTTQNTAIAATDGKMQSAYNQANVTAGGLITANANTVYIQAGLNSANANISLLFATNVNQNANIVLLQAGLNTVNANTVYIQAGLNTANANTVYLSGALATANANTVYLTGGLNSANANVTVLYGIELSQNANIVLLQTGLNTVNANTVYIQAGLNSANANIALLQAGLNTANANGVATDGKMQSAYNQANVTAGGLITANANSFYIQSGLNSANANISLLFATNAIQNTNIQYASDKANTANNLAQAAFDYANNIIVVGNTITLGTNTTGLLVSNAVTLTTSTTVTNGLASINQILGKLVPPSPAAFPGSYGTLTINTLLGPFRMTNFTQQDNTGLSTTPVVAGGTSVSPLRTSTYTTSTIFLINTQVGDVMTVYKNNASFGTRTMTAGATNAGSYGDLRIITNVDYASTGAISYANFWYSANVNATGTVANGWNTVYITDTGGVKTANATWYYDNSAPGTPTFASPSIVPLVPSLTYSSTVPHYNSSSTFRLGVDVSKLSGDMYPASDTFFTGTAGGAFGAPTSNTYTAVGITTPVVRNLYVTSGSATVNSTSTIIAGFGSSATGPSVTVDNSYSTASQVFTTALANTVLYKTGTASAMEETSVTFGTTVGTGSGLAARIINPGTTDTPTYTASAALFNSQSSTLTANDATIVASTLKHDQTNYSTAYLPAGPNLSTGRTGSQYFTFKFVRTSVSKFDVKFTGTIAGLWVALPGSVIDSTSSINGWMDMSTAYAGSGHPGVNTGGNGSNGCALGGNAVLNTLVTNGSYTCTFGDVSSSSTATNEIYVRIKLTSGQTVSALTLQTASH